MTLVLTADTGVKSQVGGEGTAEDATCCCFILLGDSFEL